MSKECGSVLYTRLADISSSWMKRFNTDIINGLTQQGISVVVIPDRKGDENPSELGVFTHKLRILESFSRMNISNGEVVLIGCPLRCAMDQLVWASEVINEKKPTFACYTLTGTFIEEDWITVFTPWVKDLEKIWYEKSDIIFVPTEYFRRKMLEHGYDDKKIFVVGAPLDSQEVLTHAQPKDTDLIIFNHRFNLDKKPEYFLKLVEDLSGQFSQLKFQISTNLSESGYWSSMDQEIKPELVETLKRFPSLKITYNDSRSKYLDLLNRAYIAPCFSTHETFGFSVTEAFAAGCLAVIPSRLTYPELAKGDTDLLYPSTGDLNIDYQGALEKIVYWLRHPDLGMKKSTEVRDYVKDYEPALVAKKMLKVINKHLR